MFSELNFNGRKAYLRDKYQKIYYKLDSGCENFYFLLASKLNYSLNDTSDSVKTISNKIKHKAALTLAKPRFKILITLPQVNLENILLGPCSGITDWTLGRFKGPLVRLVVTNGVISEKAYLSPKGNTIVIRRSWLGFFL